VPDWRFFAFLFCWHFSYKTCDFCKARSDWLQLPLAALHINRHRVTSKIHLTMPRVKMSRADRNPWKKFVRGDTAYYNLESIFRAFKRKEMKASRRLAENDIITRGQTLVSFLLLTSIFNGHSSCRRSSTIIHFFN
jgi:hypothetical protein